MVLTTAAVLASLVGSAYGIWKNEQSRRKMAQSEKERMALEDEYQDENALEAYQRQKQFQDEYLTPEAQIKSTLAGYTAAGINKMALAGVSPGASASSAPQSAGPSGTSSVPQDTGALGSLMEVLNLKLKDKQIDKQYEIDKMNAQTAKFEAQTRAFLTREQFRAEQIRNRYLEQGQQLTIEGMALSNAKTAEETYNIKANTQLLASKKVYQDIMNKYAPALMQSDIDQRKSITFLNYSRAHEVEVLAVKHTHEMSLIDAQVGKISHEIDFLISQKGLNDQMVSESAARIGKINKEIEEIGNRIGLSALDIQYYLFNHSQDVSNKFPLGTSLKKVLFPNEVTLN